MSLFKGFFSKKEELGKYQKQLKNYYVKSGYEVIPVLPEEDDAKRVLDNASMSTTSFAYKEYMKYVDRKLLRGHIVLLWWLNHPTTNKENPPKYFLFVYGIDFNEALKDLEKEKLIDGNRNLTKRGEEKLRKYHQLIREHKAKKIVDHDDKVIYSFDDNELTKDVGKFESSGDVVEDQMIGRSFERNKDFDNAILAYKSAYNLSKKSEIFSDDPPPNIFNRLSIIYRQQKKYDEEISILKIALSYYDTDKFRQRLEKAKSLRDSNKYK